MDFSTRLVHTSDLLAKGIQTSEGQFLAKVG
jgi:hypothetical protein